MSSKQEKTIYLAAPRGFCAGVDRAIEIVERSLQVYGTPLYVKHEIVHNYHVVKTLQQKGVMFIENLQEVPENSTVIFSAHGVAPSVWREAAERNLKIIDATCPLVTKVHKEAKRYAEQNYRIILIGHKNHVEAIGTKGEAPDQITIVENLEDVESLSFDNNQPTAYITQTTLSLYETADIITALKKKYPDIVGPRGSDICYATTNRQEAVSELAARTDMMLVIGSANSSNSNRLRETAAKENISAYLIDDASWLKPSMFDGVIKIGLTAGASAPEILIDQVIEALKNKYGFDRLEEVRVTEENVTFKLPEELRDEKSRPSSSMPIIK